jgi:predicted ATPase
VGRGRFASGSGGIAAGRPRSCRCGALFLPSHRRGIAQQQSAKFWELRAAISLARLWRERGKRDAARDLVGPICGWFTEGFDTPVLTEAKALLDTLAQ